MQPEHGAGVEQIQREVTIRDGIERVGERRHPELLRRERGIYGMRRTRERGRPERRDTGGLARRLEAS